MYNRNKNTLKLRTLCTSTTGNIILLGADTHIDNLVNYAGTDLLSALVGFDKTTLRSTSPVVGALETANAGTWATGGDVVGDGATLLDPYYDWEALGRNKQVKAIVFCGGASDGPTYFAFDDKIDNIYLETLSTIHAKYPDAPIYVIIPPNNFGVHWDGSNAALSTQDRREGLWRCVELYEYVHRGPEMYDITLNSWLPEAQAPTMAARLAHVLNGGSPGPAITSATTTAGSAIITVTLDIGDAYDITPDTGISGFTFTSDDVEIAISSAVKVEPQTIQLTLASVPSGTTNMLYYIRYNSTGNLANTNEVSMPALSTEIEVVGVVNYTELGISLDNTNPATNDIITYTITASDNEDDGTAVISVEGDLDDSYFDTTFVSALSTAASAATGVSFDGVDTLTISTGFTGLSWSRTLTGSPLDGDVHSVRLTKDTNLPINKSIATAICGTVTTPAVPSAIFGVNFSGAEFGYPFYDTDGSELDFYLDKGVNLIRLPFLWERVQPTLSGDLDIIGDGSGDAEKVKWMIDYITANGVYCLVDLHNFAGYNDLKMGTDGGPTCADLVDFWEKFSVYLGDNSKIIYGVMNEPVGVDMDYWWACNDAVAAAIRSKGYNNLIAVPGAAWDGAHSWITSGNSTRAESFVDPINNFIFEVHQYLDANNSGTSPVCTIDSGTRIDDATTWAETNGYRLLLGEFASGDWNVPANAQCETELGTMMDTMNTDSSVWFAWTVWGGGPWWSTEYPYILELNDAPTNLMEYYKTLWLPDSNNLMLWLDATDKSTFTYPSNYVNAAINKSASTANMSQGTAAEQPVYTEGDYLTFDLSDDNLEVTVPAGGWSGTIVMGFKQGSYTAEVSWSAGTHEFGRYMPDDQLVGVALYNDTLTDEQKTQLVNFMISKGCGGLDGWSTVTNFNNAWRINNLTSFPLIDLSSGENFQEAWRQNNLTSFPELDLSNGTNFSFSWYNNSLTSFPLIDVSNGTNFRYAWQGNALTSFPLLDLSKNTSCEETWRDNQLTSFPAIDMPLATNFRWAWRSNQLTSFPSIDISSGIFFSAAWYGNNLTSFPANMFDSLTAPNNSCFLDAWYGNAIDAQGMENILVSIDTSGANAPSSGVDITIDSNGDTLTSATNTAITSLKTKGWTITIDGVLQ